MDQDFRYVLASASPRRKELLGMLGISFDIIPSDAEEELDGLAPSELVERLSYAKASDVYSKLTENDGYGIDRLVVIGADTVVYCGGRILGKPSDVQEAVEMLRLLGGRVHEVYTGVSLIWGCGNHRVFHTVTEVDVCRLSDDEIRAYIDTGEPFDKAGAYGIQGPFMKHVRKISGDYNNVVGLPVSALYSNMKEAGLL